MGRSTKKGPYVDPKLYLKVEKLNEVGRKDPLTGAGMEQFLKTIPAGRGGRPEEVASLVAFLLGPDSGYFVGSVIFVDGGIDAALRSKDWPKVWELNM